MSPAQLRWYLYWRDQFQHGNAISTDLSYLFVHIYEGLNLVGFDTAQAAFDHLVSLWTQYRPLQPKLDRYLVDWLADFVVVHQLQIDPLDWYARALQLNWSNGGDIDFGFSAWLSGRDYTQFPLELVYRVIEYSPAKNKFYREGSDSSGIDLALVQGVRTVDEWLFESEKRGLFERDAPPVTEVVSRPPFAGAVHRYGTTPIRIAEVHRWSQATDLASDLIGILKYVENILREQAGFRSKLRGITIPPPWRVVLNRAFGVEEPLPAISSKKRGRPRKGQLTTETVSTSEAQSDAVSPSDIAMETPEITIDSDTLARLSQETVELRERLFVDDEQEIVEEHQLSEQPVQQSTTTSSKLPATYTERPTDAPEGLLTDLPEIGAAMGPADGVGAKLLRLLRDHDWQAEPRTLETVIESGFLSVQLDAINDRASEQLNDALIFFEEEVWIVAEDYRDEIDYILNHPAYSAAQTTPANSPQSTERPIDTYDELSDEWAQFAQKLQPHHWEAIATLLSGVDVIVRLDALARSAYTTSNLLVDGINDVALDTIGDIVIDTIADPPNIEDEDFEPLNQLLTWAHANQLLEL